GIFGTQFFFEVLAENGLNELAYEAMNKRDFPSFGLWIEQGATTTWEQWDGKNSRNHPMFGGALSWFYRKVAGFNVDEGQPGYKHIIIRPIVPRDLTFASYSLRTLLGEASVSWKKAQGAFLMDVVVPVGSTATLYLPASEGQAITENGKPVNKAKGVKAAGTEDGYAVFTVESGRYSLEVK
ncbi:MAG TPA: alpha-L-rhamnosidase C-terminal domain-containing protein, partial [Bacteroidales bacterium]